MYNHLIKCMSQKYRTVNDDNNGDVTYFIDDNNTSCVAGVLYRKNQVLNIFLTASDEVVWNHDGLAIFVVAKKYKVLNNARARNIEAAWLIGSCGAQRGMTLHNPMYLESAFLGDKNLTGMTEVHKTYNGIRFKLFDLIIEWQGNPMIYIGHIDYLNPALIYPVKYGGKKIINAKRYLRKVYDWEYNSGYHTAGSFETRKFIDTQANRTNHVKWSKIKYFKVY